MAGRKRWYDRCLFGGAQVDVDRKFVVNGFVAEAVEERGRAVFDVPLGAVYFDIAHGGEGFFVHGHDGGEGDGVCDAFDGEVASDGVVWLAGSSAFDGFYFGDLEGGHGEFFDGEEVIRLEVAKEFAAPFALQVEHRDGVHVYVKRTADEFAAVHLYSAFFDEDFTVVLASDFLADPGKFALFGVHVEIALLGEGQGGDKDQGGEDAQFFHGKKKEMDERMCRGCLND